MAHSHLELQAVHLVCSKQQTHANKPNCTAGIVVADAAAVTARHREKQHAGNGSMLRHMSTG
jgi:hypothetical protein